MKVLLVVSLLICSIFAQEFSDPKPSFDNPRKWLIKISTKDKDKIDHIIGGIYNVLKEYPQESINIAVAVYGPGMRMLKKDYDKKTLDRVKSLMEYDVNFIACENTMATMKWTKKDFIEDLSYVKAGIVEVIEKKVAGWIEVTPY
jgi:intracellular sulfur oxidation DsrE/DsrF family protein